MQPTPLIKPALCLWEQSGGEAAITALKWRILSPQCGVMTTAIIETSSKGLLCKLWYFVIYTKSRSSLFRLYELVSSEGIIEKFKIQYQNYMQTRCAPFSRKSFIC